MNECKKWTNELYQLLTCMMVSPVSMASCFFCSSVGYGCCTFMHTKLLNLDYWHYLLSITIKDCSLAHSNTYITYIQVLKEPGSHGVGGHFREYSPLFLFVSTGRTARSVHWTRINCGVHWAASFIYPLRNPGTLLFWTVPVFSRHWTIHIAFPLLWTRALTSLCLQIFVDCLYF